MIKNLHLVHGNVSFIHISNVLIFYNLRLYLSKGICIIFIACGKLCIMNVFLGSNHWVCTSSQRAGVVHVMDSLSLFFPLNQSTCLQISKIYSFSKSHLRIQTCSVQQQIGSHDCGLFAIATALEICCGNNPELATFDQQMMRSHLIDCFKKRRLSSFPKMNQESLPRPSRCNYVVNG